MAIRNEEHGKVLQLVKKRFGILLKFVSQPIARPLTSFFPTLSVFKQRVKRMNIRKKKNKSLFVCLYGTTIVEGEWKDKDRNKSHEMNNSSTFNKRAISEKYISSSFDTHALEKHLSESCDDVEIEKIVKK